VKDHLFQKLLSLYTDRHTLDRLLYLTTKVVNGQWKNQRYLWNEAVELTI